MSGLQALRLFTDTRPAMARWRRRLGRGAPMLPSVLVIIALCVNVLLSDEIFQWDFVSSFVHGWREASPQRNECSKVAVRFFLEALSEAAKQGTPEKQLTVAAQTGQEDEVRRLLMTEKVDPNEAGRGGVTPLLMAAINGHDAIVRLLVENGADPNQEMSRAQGSATPLFLAAQQGHEPAVRSLIEAGATIDTARIDGATPLFAASKNGHGPVVRLLLDNGANANLSTDAGDTPLLVASAIGHTEIVDLLQPVTTAGDDGDA